MNVYSIFRSVSGEAGGPIKQGEWCIFLRLAGCNLSLGCTYCDTEYAQDTKSGTEMDRELILKAIHDFSPTKKILITGGEPLLQDQELITLCLSLKERGYSISVETNGTIMPSGWLQSVVDWFIFDYKTPSSGINPSKIMNFNYVTFPCSVKFVCSNEDDLEAVLKFHKKYGKKQFEYWISPCRDLDGTWHLFPDGILKWINKNNLHFIGLNSQLHKLLHLNEHP